MGSRLLLGLEFDGEYDPRVRSELEQLVAALQTWQGQVATNDAQFLVAAASEDLTAERVGVSSPTILVDYGTRNQAKWHANTAAFAAGYTMGSFDSGDSGSDGPPGRDGAAGATGATGATGPQGSQPAVLVLDGVDGEDCWIPGPQGPQGAAGTSGKVVQMVSTTFASVATGSTQIPFDNTIPQSSEGDEYMTRAITPTSSTTTLIIQVLAMASSDTAARAVTVALFQDSGTDAINATGASGSNVSYTIPLQHSMTSGTTSATTFKVRIGLSGTGTTTFNGSGGAVRYGTAPKSSIVIWEVTTP